MAGLVPAIHAFPSFGQRPCGWSAQGWPWRGGTCSAAPEAAIPGRHRSVPRCRHGHRLGGTLPWW